MMKKILLQYEEASGQGVNFTKSGIMFSSNVPSTLAAQLHLFWMYQTLSILAGTWGSSH